MGKQLIFQTVGCIGKASIRFEESLKYIEQLRLDKHKEFFDKIRCFVSGCLEIDSHTEGMYQEKAFQTAIHSKYLRAIEFMLGDSESPDPTHIIDEWEERNLLVHSLESESYDVAKMLISCGADLNADFPLSRNSSPSKLLFKMCESNSKNVLQKLVELGIDVYIKDSKKRNVLFYCESREIYDFFMNLGIDEDEFSYGQGMVNHFSEKEFVSNTWTLPILQVIAEFTIGSDHKNWYRVELSTIIRAGKALDSERLRDLARGGYVHVVEVHDRRARIDAQLMDGAQ